MLLIISANALAQSELQEVYLCVDEKGHREYKNTGNVKGCKKVELPGLTSVPAPAPPKRVANNSGNNSGNGGKNASSPGEFPKVDDSTQKARDNDRKQILLDELRSEEAKLSNLKRDYQGGEPPRQGNEANYAKYQERVTQMRDDIGRVEKNIEALKRELANIK
jgi:hypothetical protein